MRISGVLPSDGGIGIRSIGGSAWIAVDADGPGGGNGSALIMPLHAPQSGASMGGSAAMNSWPQTLQRLAKGMASLPEKCSAA